MVFSCSFVLLLIYHHQGKVRTWYIFNELFKHVSGYILVKVQHVSKSKNLGGISGEVRISAPPFGPGFSLV